MIEYLLKFPPEIATILIAMTPVFELRGAIPAAVCVYGLSFWQAYFWAVIGNMIPAFLLILFLKKVSEFLISKSKAMERFFNWLFKRTQRKFVKKHEKYGAAALIIFVAIPLPVTGVWTASVAAFLFGIRPKIAVPYMLIGVIIAGLIVNLLFLGVCN